MAAAWDFVADAQLSYHLSGNGRSHIFGERLQRFTMELEINGDDYAGRINTIGGSGKVRIVRKDGVMYIRPAGGKWQSRRLTTPVIQMTPFMGLGSAADLTYGEAVTEKGRTLHKLVSTNRYRPNIPRMLEMSKFSAKPDLVQLELFVTDDGVPIRASFRCELQRKDQEGNMQFVGTAEYTFTKFGADFSIKAP